MKNGSKFMIGLFGGLLAIGMIVIFGAAGSSDAGMIGVYELGRRLLEGGAVALVGLAGIIAVMLREEVDE